jgi:hypothetical protein
LSEIVEVPREAFLALVESFLNGNYQLYPTVRGMTVKRKIGCDHCGATVPAWSPDDRNTILSINSGKESVERKIKCEKCKRDNLRYWLKAAGLQVRTLVSRNNFTTRLRRFMVKLTERKMRWIVQEKLRGRGTSEIALIQRVSHRPVEQV